MDIHELADFAFKASMLFCADKNGNDLAEADDPWEANDWLVTYGARLAQVVPFIPDREPDAVDSDGFCHWWRLHNGVSLCTFGEEYEDGDGAGGYIIPPEADPPPIKGFRWLTPQDKGCRIYSLH